MKNIAFIATFIFGFTGATFAQINLEEESTKGTVLEVTEGMTMVYGANYFGTEFDIIFKIKSLNQHVVFDYEILNEKNNKGTLTMEKEALEIARAQDNYYHEGGIIDLPTQTSIWVSKLVFNELITNGGMDAESDWLYGTYGTVNWAISGGLMSIVDPNNWSWFYQDFGAEVGKLYKLTLTVTVNEPAASLWIRGISCFGSYEFGLSSPGTRTRYYMAIQSGPLDIAVNAGIGTISVDNVSVKEVKYY